MSKVTSTRLNRSYEGSTRDGIVKKQKIDPSRARTEETIEWKGVTFKVLMSPGQVINKEKLYKRERKKMGFSY